MAVIDNMECFIEETHLEYRSDILQRLDNMARTDLRFGYIADRYNVVVCNRIYTFKPTSIYMRAGVNMAHYKFLR